MAIEFMVIAAPRSATTWCANWLTTQASLCLHDPLLRVPYSELDKIRVDAMLGISCTAIALFPEWVNAHPARKVILHRDLMEIDASMRKIGMTEISEQWTGVLERIHGVHIDWQDVFHHPKNMYEYLLNQPFDKVRHAELCQMNVQPAFRQLSIDPAATARLMHELRNARMQ